MGALLRALALVLLSPLVLHALALVLPVKMLAFAAHAIASITCLVVAACYGVVSSVVLRAVGYGGLSQWTTARAFKWIMWFSTGVSFVVVEGEEHLAGRPAVLVGNHQT